MNIPERVYTLDERKSVGGNRLFLLRNGLPMVCPTQGDRYCGEWCPAFEVHGERCQNVRSFSDELSAIEEARPAMVVLHCFPQPVSFVITDPDQKGD